MGGGLLQLVAYGAQDVYLTGNPQITFFKVVYRRHTNFAMEAIQQTFSGITAFGNTVYCQISRNGDLINRTYVEVTLPPLLNTNTLSTDPNYNDRYVNYVGLKLLKTITLEIGGQQIDKHYSDWLYIWNELSLPISKKEGWEYMVGGDQHVTSFSDTQINGNVESTAGKKLYIPLEFWFCRNIGLALPLIALQYHEVKIKIEFETLNNCVYKLSSSNTVAPSSTTITALSTLNVNLWVDYIFLDTDERRRFAQLSHEYLIEQIQFTGSENLSNGYNRIKLNFNHPCKELIWVAKFNSSTNVNQWYNYTLNFTAPTNYTLPTAETTFSYPSLKTTDIHDYLAGTSYDNNTTSNVILANNPAGQNTVNPFNTCLLQLNGNDRFAERPASYFNYIQPFQHHTNISLNKGINVYSFAIKPEEHQPSGTLNMSRIDTAVLSLSTNPNTPALTNAVINIYATNYNVLRILSGMGGLAYSN